MHMTGSTDARAADGMPDCPAGKIKEEGSCGARDVGGCEADAAVDRCFMELALEQAKKAAAIGEVPIGAVVVCNGEVVASAYNRREVDKDPAGHAEFIACKEAARTLDRWRLSGCTVYVTLEPCLMCAGLMYQSRIDRCVFAAPDPKAGALGTLYSIHTDERLNHSFEVTGGILQEESAALLKGFFSKLRSASI